MRKEWRLALQTFTTGFIEAGTGRSRHDESTSGSRMGGNVLATGFSGAPTYPLTSQGPASQGHTWQELGATVHFRCRLVKAQVRK
jgi:hypothetical protein